MLARILAKANATAVVTVAALTLLLTACGPAEDTGPDLSRFAVPGGP
ncbi:hypothetical protein [Actinophytocola xinjiangensis]|nr:hypothetical protein [Actinophytocola xinjiangensis]